MGARLTTLKVSTYIAPLEAASVTSLPPGAGHPIDRIVDAYFAKNKIAPPAALDDVAFVRRVHLDLIGLVPAPSETAACLKDTAPDKRAKLIGRLLENEGRCYADHWLAFWNDLLRNEYSGTGYIDGGRKQISAWLYRSLVENKPYDQFVRELISPKADAEGFIKGIKWQRQRRSTPARWSSCNSRKTCRRSSSGST